LGHARAHKIIPTNGAINERYTKLIGIRDDRNLRGSHENKTTGGKRVIKSNVEKG
jgi:hypothetical protein